MTSNSKWSVQFVTPPPPKPTGVVRVDLTMSELELLLDGLAELARPSDTASLKNVLAEASDALSDATPPTPVVYRGAQNETTYQG